MENLMTEVRMICNVPVHDVSMDESLEIIDALVQKKNPSYIVTPNVDHIVRLQKDEEFRRCYEQAALVTPDGMPLLWAGKFLGQPLKEKVSGSDLFFKVCELAEIRGYRIYMLGGMPGVAEKAAERLKADYPGLQVAGTYAPPFHFEQNQKELLFILDKIRAAAPDILFVGLGSPKQEKWLNRYYKELNVPVSLGIGASIDFAAGKVKRAPVWMQRAGLEWFWRLVMEPGRLWKRYLVDDMGFLGLLLKTKWSGLGKQKTASELVS